MESNKIYYNPNCSKCRQTKSILDEKNIDMDVIEYLSTTLTEQELAHIISLGISATALIRTGESEWAQTGLDIDNASDDALINAILNAPILLQRPIVLANGKAVIARPAEKVLEII